MIVVSGPSTVACAETLRQEGFKGRVILVSRENELPYDRPKLSKVRRRRGERGGRERGEGGEGEGGKG